MLDEKKKRERKKEMSNFEKFTLGLRFSQATCQQAGTGFIITFSGMKFQKTSCSVKKN